MLTHKAHYHHEHFFIFAIRSLTVACCSAFASKYHISSWNPYFSCQHQTGIDAVFFCCKYGKHHPWHASLKYVQLLHWYNGTIHYPFYHILLRDSEGIDWKSNIHTRVTSYPSLSPQFLSELPQTKQLELLSKDLCGNCQKDVSCNWNISFSLSSPNFSVSRLHVYQLSL